MPISATKRRNNDNYNAKCDYISIRPIKARGQKIRQAAEDAGQSLQGYILQACEERMQRDAANAGQHSAEDAAPSAPMRTPAQE